MSLLNALYGLGRNRWVQRARRCRPGRCLVLEELEMRTLLSYSYTLIAQSGGPARRAPASQLRF